MAQWLFGAGDGGRAGRQCVWSGDGGGGSLIALDIAPRDGLGVRAVFARVPVAKHLPRAGGRVVALDQLDAGARAAAVVGGEELRVVEAPRAVVRGEGVAPVEAGRAVAAVVLAGAVAAALGKHVP